MASAATFTVSNIAVFEFAVVWSCSGTQGTSKEAKY